LIQLTADRGERRDYLPVINISGVTAKRTIETAVNLDICTRLGTI